jgi:acetyl-CoA carboxylase biotin carboxyl carrier protein
MTIDEIRELIRLAQESGIAELEVHFGNDSVRITLGGSKRTEMVVPAVLPISVAPSPAQNPAYTPPQAPASPPPARQEEEQPVFVVKSPIVGTYYDSSSPGDAPFVKVGDQVHPKQVLCIIESMKLMNEIEADIGGTIVAKLVENGRPVEYGESLFTIRPL